jgi:uncharacterized protein (DUF1810 family)
MTSPSPGEKLSWKGGEKQQEGEGKNKSSASPSWAPSSSGAPAAPAHPSQHLSDGTKKEKKSFLLQGLSRRTVKLKLPQPVLDSKNHTDDAGHHAPDDDDPYDLHSRFVENQEIYFPSALAELRQGRKRGCWLWFMLPTPPYVVNGIERGSSMNQHYSLRGDASTKAYLHHPILRTNYLQLICTIATQLQFGNTLRNIFGPMDDVKVIASLTLFERIGRELGDVEIANACRQILLLQQQQEEEN